MSHAVPFYFHQQQPRLRFFTGDLVQQSLSTLIKFIRKRRLIKDRRRIHAWGAWYASIMSSSKPFDA